MMGEVKFINFWKGILLLITHKSSLSLSVSLSVYGHLPPILDEHDTRNTAGEATTNS